MAGARALMAQALRVARRFGANLARAARRLAARGALPRDQGVWIAVQIGPLLDELAPAHWPWTRDEAQSLLDVLRVLEQAGEDPGVDGVLLRFAGSPSGWSRVASLRRAILRVRERGKPTVAYADVLDAEGLLAASAADRLWLPESGQIMLVGLRLEGFFLRGLLDRLSVQPEVIRIGDHKSAGERFTRASMSPEEREQLEDLADDWFDELVEGIARGRGLDPAAVRDRVDRGPYTARAAVEAGLADACLYPDEIERELEALAPLPPDARPGPRRVRLVDAAVYHALRVGDPGWRPLLTGLPRVAYVVARGMIHRGHGPRGIASDSLRGLLERLRREEEVRSVVLRLDTPGGEPLASDLIWRQIQVLTREKPVVVSMGDVVASGGYYLAAGADAIWAEAGTLTGSIGVVGGKLNLAGLYERVGLAKDGVERGARAGVLSEARGFTPDERKALRGDFAAAYALFLDRVARGRGLSLEAVDRVARGRVWSGVRARRLGLVDGLGGPLEALREARRLAGLTPDERVLLDVHPRLPSLPRLALLRQLLPRRAVRAWP
jgi:protease-4